MYLPVYLWTVHCRKQGINMFWELLNLISKCEGEKLLNLETLPEKSTDSDPRAPCLFCGREIKQKRLRKHLIACKDR